MLVSTSTKTPIYEVKFDEHKLTVSDSVEQLTKQKQRIIYKLEFETINKIEIVLKNKDPSDTKTFKGQIVEDLLIIVEQLKIDSIDFTKKLPKISQYKDFENRLHFTNGYITFNGVYTIKFHQNVLYTNWLSSFL